HDLPHQGCGLPVQRDPPQVHVVVGLPAGGQRDPAVHDGQVGDELLEAVSLGRHGPHHTWPVSARRVTAWIRTSGARFAPSTTSRCRPVRLDRWPTNAAGGWSASWRTCVSAVRRRCWRWAAADSFDAAWTMSTLMHLPGDDFQRALRE